MDTRLEPFVKSDIRPATLGARPVVNRNKINRMIQFINNENKNEFQLGQIRETNASGDGANLPLRGEACLRGERQTIGTINGPEGDKSSLMIPEFKSWEEFSASRARQIDEGINRLRPVCRPPMAVQRPTPPLCFPAYYLNPTTVIEAGKIQLWANDNHSVKFPYIPFMEWGKHLFLQADYHWSTQERPGYWELLVALLDSDEKVLKQAKLSFSASRPGSLFTYKTLYTRYSMDDKPLPAGFSCVQMTWSAFESLSGVNLYVVPGCFDEL